MGWHRSPHHCTDPARRPSHPAPPRPAPPTATVPRCMGWHRSPHHCSNPTRRPNHPAPPGPPHQPPPSHVAWGGIAVLTIAPIPPVGLATPSPDPLRQPRPPPPSRGAWDRCARLAFAPTPAAGRTHPRCTARSWPRHTGPCASLARRRRLGVHGIVARASPSRRPRPPAEPIRGARRGPGHATRAPAPASPAAAVSGCMGSLRAPRLRAEPGRRPNPSEVHGAVLATPYGPPAPAPPAAAVSGCMGSLRAPRLRAEPGRRPNPSEVPGAVLATPYGPPAPAPPAAAVSGCMGSFARLAFAPSPAAGRTHPRCTARSNNHAIRTPTARHRPRAIAGARSMGQPNTARAVHPNGQAPRSDTLSLPYSVPPPATPASAQRCPHLDGSPDPRGAWDRCARSHSGRKQPPVKPRGRCGNHRFRGQWRRRGGGDEQDLHVRSGLAER